MTKEQILALVERDPQSALHISRLITELARRKIAKDETKAAPAPTASIVITVHC